MPIYMPITSLCSKCLAENILNSTLTTEVRDADLRTFNVVCINCKISKHEKGTQRYHWGGSTSILASQNETSKFTKM